MAPARKPKAREILAANVRRERGRLGWSQEELGSKAGITQTYVSQIESSRRAVSIDVLERLSWALRVSTADLLNR